MYFYFKVCAISGFLWQFCVVVFRGIRRSCLCACNVPRELSDLSVPSDILADNSGLFDSVPFISEIASYFYLLLL